MSQDTILAVEKLNKEYRTGMRRKRVRAVTDVSFEVRRGEIFGFVGPNGAGKTTTIRSIMGLIRPTSGRCMAFGLALPDRGCRARIGFLPESPYFYDYLSAPEMIDLMGRLHGVEASLRKRRAGELLERVGLGHAGTKSMRKFSKGMLQRAGLAQALINDPELVILDEPQSGLDPLGRKEVRDLIVELQGAGKTVFFSSHILPDVEAICDRVAIITGGVVRDVGPVRQLIGEDILGTEVVLDVPPEQTMDDIVPAGAKMRRVDRIVTLDLPAGADVSAYLRQALGRGRVVSVAARRASLEDLFVERTREAHP